MDLTDVLELQLSTPSESVAILVARDMSCLIIQADRTEPSIAPATSVFSFVETWILAQYDELGVLPWFEFDYERCCNGTSDNNARDVLLLFLHRVKEEGHAPECCRIGYLTCERTDLSQLELWITRANNLLLGH